MDEALEDKLARVGARVREREDARRDQVRAILEREPQLLELLEAARETFGARLTWIKAEGFEQGRELPRGIVPTRPFTVKRRGRDAGK